MDLRAARSRFQSFLARQLDVPRVELSEFEIPGHGGMSNETLLCTARLGHSNAHPGDPGGERDLALAVRIEPEAQPLFPDASLERQCRSMRLVSETEALPVPTIHFESSDREVFGRPFYVMDRVPGRIPSDNPPYQLKGWLKQADATEQARVQSEALEAMARLHRVEPRDFDTNFLLRPQYGSPGLDEDMGYWRSYLTWAAGGTPLPVLEAALEWCVQHKPTSVPRSSINWGDARLGNLVFDDAHRLSAVLDWEMAFLGPAELDLGWFLFLHETALIWLDDLPGFRDREESLAIYQAALGRRVRDLPFYQAWAGFKAAAIRARMVERDFALGLLQDRRSREDNPVVTSLRRLIPLPEAH